METGTLMGRVGKLVIEAGGGNSTILVTMSTNRADIYIYISFKYSYLSWKQYNLALG